MLPRTMGPMARERRAGIGSATRLALACASLLWVAPSARSQATGPRGADAMAFVRLVGDAE
jgi:hypothetical protein